MKENIFFNQFFKDKLEGFSKALLVTLVFFIFSAASFSQTKTVTGIVKDDLGEPLIGVSVAIVNTNTGTVTNFDGEYSIKVNEGDHLQFSYIGMKPQNIKVGTSDVINVTLVSDSKMLAETVVIGYGTAKKADLTGSIANISAKEIMQQPSASPVQSVQGKVSGVTITASDAPGSSPDVVIRGLGTALGGRRPLYIVDGFPVDNISNISPSDILSMNVLKDASSASIYGMRAANGVIIISTKKGQEGTTKVNIESYAGIKNVLNRVKMANASQFIEYYNENLAMLKKYDPKNADVYLQSADQQQYNTNWYDELLRTGFVSQTSASVAGGGKNMNYFLGYNYYKENGILSGQDYDRTTIRNNNNYKLFNDLITIKQNVSISFSTDRTKPYGAFNNAYKQSPLVPTYFNLIDPAGNAYSRYGKSNYDKATGIAGINNLGNESGFLNSIGNPLETVNSYNQKNQNFTLQGGVEVELKITDYLKANTRFGMTKYTTKERNYANQLDSWLNRNPLKFQADFENERDKADAGKSSPSASYAYNKLTLNRTDYLHWTWENFVTFNKSFDKNHVEVVVGTSMEKDNIKDYESLIGYNVPYSSQYWSIKHSNTLSAPLAYPSEIANQYTATPIALASFFGRVQYNYDSRYYLTATVRRDGSSAFKMSSNYWGTFPSFGVGWNINRESFLTDATWLNHLKLKGNWGKLGNQNIPYNLSSILTDSSSSGNYNYPFGQNPSINYGAAFGTPALPLSWEVTREWGLGFEFAALDQRLTGGFDYYNKLNTNAILYVSPTGTSMYSEKFYDHGAKISNKGIELELGWADVLSNGLSYSVNLNYSHNTNLVKEVKTAYDGDTGGSLSDGQITKRLVAGQPLYAWWMYQADGIWQTQEEIDANPHLSTARPGHIKYKDINNDGQISDEDKVYAGSYLPKYTYGITVNLGYKNFDFSVAGYGVGGNKIYNGLKYTRINGGENIAYDTWANRWTPENKSNTYVGANRDAIASTYFLESGAYFRINNITLGYTFKDVVSKGTSLRVYATAQNPFIFTGYSGFSPEIAPYAANVADIGDPKGTTGIELSAYPSLRSFLFGVNLSF